VRWCISKGAVGDL